MSRSAGLSYSTIYGVALTVLAILFSILLFEVPPFMDDLNFTIGIEGADSIAERLSLCGRTMRRLYYTDAFRLHNIYATPILILLPKWIKVAILTGWLLIMIEGGRRAMSLSKKSILTYLWIAAAMLLLPWYDMMVATTFFLNYIPASALTLWTIYYVVAHHPDEMSSRKYLLILLLAFCAGWSHEAFCLPLCFFLTTYCLYLLIVNRKIPWKPAGITMAVALGIIPIVIAPSLLNRASGTTDATQAHPLWEMVMNLGPAAIASLFLLILSLIAYFKHKATKSVVIGIASLAAIIVSIAIGLRFKTTPRSFWAATLYACFGAIYILDQFRPAFWRHKGCMIAASSILMSLVYTNLIAAIIKQKKYGAEYSRVIEAYRHCDNPYGEVYADVTPPKIDLSLWKTSARALNEAVPLDFISMHYGDGTSLHLLPESLKDFAESADTTRYREGLWPKPKYIIYRGADMEPWMERTPILTLETSEGSIESRYSVTLFHNHEGAEYLLIIPHIVTLSPDTQILNASYSH